jgi:hypothetical protein
MSAAKNHVTYQHGECAGQASAICCKCKRTSAPVHTLSNGEPDLSELKKWSVAWYSANFEHKDGSRGSRFYCPLCKGTKVKP